MFPEEADVNWFAADAARLEAQAVPAANRSLLAL